MIFISHSQIQNTIFLLVNWKSKTRPQKFVQVTPLRVNHYKEHFQFVAKHQKHQLRSRRKVISFDTNNGAPALNFVSKVTSYHKVQLGFVAASASCLPTTASSKARKFCMYMFLGQYFKTNPVCYNLSQRAKT